MDSNNMTDYAIYFQEVLDAHLAIEQWFAGGADSGSEAALLARFSPDFSMVTPDGRQLDKAALGQLFAQAAGQRPGFKIAVSDLYGIDQHEDGAIVAYREEQVDGAGRRTLRVSTVVFRRTVSGELLWRHLHESWAA